MTVTTSPRPAPPPLVPTKDTERDKKARRRMRELILLVFVTITGSVGLLVIQVGYDDNYDLVWLWFGLLLGGCFLAAHMVVRLLAPHADAVVLPAAAMLLTVGLVVIRRVDLGERDQILAKGEEVTSNGQADNQFLWIIAGVVLFALTLWLVKDHRNLLRYTYVSGFLGLLLLALPGFLPASMSEVNGADIWIKTPWFSIQPLEFAKPLMVTFFAGYFMLKREALSQAGMIRILGITFPRMRDAFVLFAAWVATMLILVLEGELGTTMLFYGIFLGMLYVATNRVGWVILGTALFLGGYAAMYFLSEKIANRVDCWLDPFSDPSGSCFQIVQAQYGIAAGGLFGSGLAEGHPEFVPEARTDFIFAAICELIGLFGATAVLLVITYMLTRGSKTSLLVRDPFGRLLAIGLAFSLGLQYFIILGGVTRVLPLTGITAPFLSYGGSSTLANFIIIALIVRVSSTARRPVSLTGPPPDTVTNSGSAAGMGAR